MSWLSWLTRRRFGLDEDDFEDEIRSHLAMAERDRIADGADPEDAHYAALREFGNVTLTTEAARKVWTPRWLEVVLDIAADVRYAVRTLLKRPAFALTVVGVLTLGIGANAAVFTMLKSVALNPLSGVAHSADLVVAYAETSSGRQLRLSYPDYQHLREHSRSFEDLFGSSLVTVNLGRGRGARQVWSELVTGNYFHVLGVHAQLGRTLLPSDETAPGEHPVVVLSDGLWRHDYQADPAIVGRTIEINNVPFTVVGVADGTYHGTIVSYDIELFMPVTMAAQIGLTGGLPEREAANVLTNRQASVVFPHGFLAPGVTVAAAAAELKGLWAAQAGTRVAGDADLQLELARFWLSPTGAQTFVLPTLGVLATMGLLVLAIACANIAGLVLVRGVSRRGEIALRLAIGATRARIVRLLVVENLVLAVPGAVLGVTLALYAIPVLMGYAQELAAPQRVFFNNELDRYVLAFAALVACGSALVFGFVPAVRSTRVDLVTIINEDASPRGAGRGRARAGLVVAQVAVSLLLLVGAGLTSRSVDEARGMNPGYDQDHVTAIRLEVKQNGYDTARGRHFYRALLDAVRAQPGTESASLAAYTPLALLPTRAVPMVVEGYEPRRGEDLAFLSNVVGPDYFATLRIPLVSGREFEDRDDGQAPQVAVVNRTLAERFFGGPAGAIGKRVRVAETWRTVVGVAADAKYLQIDETPRPYVYVPFLQSYRSEMVLHTRGGPPVQRLVDQARAAITALDAEMPILSAYGLRDATRGAFIFYDFAAFVLSVFGLAGLGLAGLGTYGLVSYVVKQSTHEIGVRLALGAPALSVLRGVLQRGLRLGVIGAAVGIVGAVAIAGSLRSVLFGVSTTDPVAYGRAVAVVLGGVGLASLVPAWRAARTDPLRALRHE